MIESSPAWRFAAFAAAGLFLCFALVQLNDPDPIAWVVVYSVTAAYSAFAAVRPARPAPFFAWAALCLLIGVATIAGWDGNPSPMGGGGLLGEEAVREALGLALASAWTAIAAARQVWISKKTKE